MPSSRFTVARVSLTPASSSFRCFRHWQRSVRHHFEFCPAGKFAITNSMICFYSAATVQVYKDELYHWGVKGMKWGVRRYQNKDGTLTAEGKKRYIQDHDDYTRVHTKKSVREMSDSELNSRINRLQKEQQYEHLTASPGKIQKAVKIAAAAATAFGTIINLYNNGSAVMKLGKNIVSSDNFKNTVVSGALYTTMKVHGA